MQQQCNLVKEKILTSTQQELEATKAYNKTECVLNGNSSNGKVIWLRY
jgi:hypothetical protein